MRSATCVGRYEGEQPGAPCLMLGSHLDTVRNAGKYDGMLGVVAAIECVHTLHARGTAAAVRDRGGRLRRRGRRALRLHAARQPRGRRHVRRGAARQPRHGRHVDARRAAPRSGSIPRASATPCGAARKMLAYAELHIEQGPVLEAEGLPVGVVTAINGANRFLRRDRRHGRPCGHGADVAAARRARGRGRMRARRSKRAAAREPELVGTVGKLEALPGATNVIPGKRPLHDRPARAVGRAAPARPRPTSTRADRSICARRGVKVDDRADARRQDRVLRAVAAAADRQRDRRPRACRCAACRPAPATTAWRWSISPTSACCSSAARAASATTRSRRSRVDDAELSARVFLRFIEQFKPSTLRAASMSAATVRAIDDYLARERERRRAFSPSSCKVPSDNPPGDCAPHAERTAALLEGLGLRGRAPSGAARTPFARTAWFPRTNLVVRERFGTGPDDRAQRARRRRAAGPRAGRSIPTAPRSATDACTAAASRCRSRTSRRTPMRCSR